MLFPQDIFSKIMDYCDTRHQENLKKVLNDLLLVTDIEKCENLFSEELELLEVDEESHAFHYDMSEIDSLIQKRLKGLFVRTECLTGFINNTILAREIFLIDYYDDYYDASKLPSINTIYPVNYKWSV